MVEGVSFCCCRRKRRSVVNQFKKYHLLIFGLREFKTNKNFLIYYFFKNTHKKENCSVIILEEQKKHALWTVIHQTKM